jgi:serine/threonine protein kinase/TPR repeat protein
MAEPVRFQHFEVPVREDGSLFELGRGAMGITYKAFDTNLRCFVALKVINAAYLGSDVAKQRFLREARAAAALRHPNVATVFHLGEEGGNCFYAMEFVEGETVEALMKRDGPIPANAALEIVLQVARALGAAQKQGLVHRDIKPSNLMLVRDDEGELTVKVIDFGLAKSTAADGGETAALTVGGFLGTPHFASPEQLEERDLDVRSDIYSLGVTLYYMLAGRAPFSGSLAQVMSQHLHRDPPLERLAGQHPMVLDLLRHMLAKDAAARPQTPLDLRREMEACLAAIRAEPRAAGPAAPVDPENFETQDLTSPIESSSVEPVPGAVLAGRYRILREVPASDLGRIFQAEPVGSSAPAASLAVLVPNPASLASAEALTRLENQVFALRKLSDPGLQKIFSLERAGHLNFLTLEWIEGPTLLDLMRARRALPPAEALPILRRMASAFDALQSSGAACPDIASHEVLLPGTDPAVPVGEAVEVKFNPLTADVPSASPDVTVVASAFAMLRDSGGVSADEPRAYVYALASTAYDLLGGIRSGSSSGAPVPIAGLGEAANAALRRALNPSAAPFPSCAVFLDALEGRDVAEPEWEAEPETPRPAAPMPDIVVPPSFPKPPDGRPKWFLRPVVWFGAAAAVAVCAAGWIVLTPAPVVVVTVPTPATPTPVPTPTPDVVKSELDRILADSSASPSSTFDALLALDRAHPERQDVRPAIASWLAALAKKSKSLAPAEAAALQTRLEPVATEFPDAAILLGSMAKPNNPAAALRWFLIAAEQGRAEAMVQAGQIYANGTGLPGKDNSSAVKWFQQASDLGDPMGQVFLADCYLRGVGVEINAARALKLLRSASAKSNPDALYLLGTLHINGIPNVLAPDREEAKRLFSAAMDLGNLDAQGNLAALILSDDKDAIRAGELFEDGAKKNNPFCMFLYAGALEDGLGNIPPDKARAREWYLRSAQAGHKPAREWCEKNGIPLRLPGSSPGDPSGRPSPQ